MFVGAINSTLRQFLAHEHAAFTDARVVVGCSGNFTSEATLTQFADPAEIHSNDVSLYSSMVGAWLTNTPFPFEIASQASGSADSSFDWLEPYVDTPERAISTLMILLEMLNYEKQNNAHRVRMWAIYREQFPDLVQRTVDGLAEVNVRVDSYFAGDVFDHFRRFEDAPDAIFCCYAPTYSGGYERMYKRLETIFKWDEPTYPMLDEKRRDELLAWMAQRRYLWYDDRLLEGYTPVLKQDRGLQRTVYLYSNVVQDPALFAGYSTEHVPALPLAPSDFEITEHSQVDVRPITTSDLSLFKDVYLSKRILHGQGTWAFSVYVDGWVAGFFEFAMPKSYAAPDWLYLMSDFPVDGTPYKRLSKLMVMLAVSGETRAMMERIRQYRVRHVTTTAFTDHPVSMKYRGVMNLVKRGETDSGQKYLNYEQDFNGQSWAEVLAEWRQKHNSKTP